MRTSTLVAWIWRLEPPLVRRVPGKSGRRSYIKYSQSQLIYGDLMIDFHQLWVRTASVPSHQHSSPGLIQPGTSIGLWASRHQRTAGSLGTTYPKSWLRTSENRWWSATNPQEVYHCWNMLKPISNRWVDVFSARDDIVVFWWQFVAQCCNTSF